MLAPKKVTLFIFISLFFITTPETNAVLTADSNNDGAVDGVDYITWLIHYDLTTQNGKTDGDFNSDTKVDGVDYIMWLNQYGLKETPTPSQPLPTIQELGIPYSSYYPNPSYYPRNIWDMQFYNNKMYISAGNSANTGPNINAGPVPIIAYDLNSKQFVTEYTVAEEQIEKYRIIDGKLYIPGHDPKTGSQGSVYIRDATSWIQKSTIPGIHHVYDVAAFDNKLFAAIGADSRSVILSNDNGNTWHTALSQPGRVYELFEFKGTLYALQFIVNSSSATDSALFMFSGSEFIKAEFAGNLMLPGIPNTKYYARITRSVSFQNNFIYIAAEYFNDHQWNPLSLNVASTLPYARRVLLNDSPSFLPYDILVRENTLYVLASTKKGTNTYTNAIFSTTDLTSWKLEHQFDYDTFARSFEEVNGSFYLGMGTGDGPQVADLTQDKMSSSSGKILQVTIK